MEIKLVDPRSLVENPDRARRSKSSPQSDALLLATVKAVGIVQPPVVAPQGDGGNGFVIQSRASPREAGDRGWPRRNHRSGE